jgi:hypothetical protein
LTGWALRRLRDRYSHSSRQLAWTTSHPARQVWAMASTPQAFRQVVEVSRQPTTQSAQELSQPTGGRSPQDDSWQSQLSGSAQIRSQFAWAARSSGSWQVVGQSLAPLEPAEPVEPAELLEPPELIEPPELLEPPELIEPLELLEPLEPAEPPSDLAELKFSPVHATTASHTITAMGNHRRHIIRQTIG